MIQALTSRRKLLQCIAALSLSGAALMAHAADAPRVQLKTSMGDIVLELDADKAPVTVANFIKYVKSGQYNGTIFHRVINGFMIQGGGFDQNMREKPTQAPIKNEAKNGLKNEAYTIAMARTADPQSAAAQFFINVANNRPLDYPSRDGWGYAVFGKVVQGSDVVDKIKQVRTGSSGMFDDVPVTPVIIQSATVLK
ncbi:peptidyl-prolyl cis-trans isomerase (rotamase) - cyclophilin family [Herbaspirillum sp. CF444]|uniref:peptidylprolyl isomerase n=1 Tax=Herbaspirillum sp. CF444 TaxID=1144319 RepID=UPI00027283A0|nr:peptidylprolyl isomerase [Herbaspirillum sp. CF444]EJL92222.1 peptidyl-prolyl cis-trans isomerase (rotamase) - cyclophilin family [Herbaspirillum sp. CF444]